MKRTWTLLAALALLAAPCWAGSGIGAYGTWWDTDDADDDIGAGILLELGLGSRFDLELRTSWYGSLTTLAGGELVDFSATSIRAGVAYNFFPGAINPYVGGGFDYVLFDLDDESQGRIPDDGGWYGLVGVELPVGRNFRFFAEGLYTNAKATLEGNDLGFSEPNEKIQMAGPAFNVGLTFGW